MGMSFVSVPEVRLPPGAQAYAESRTQRDRRAGPHLASQHTPPVSDAPYARGEDWDLVQLALAGDEDALELLFAPRLRKLRHVALAILRNNEDAEDALQDGLCRAYSCLHSYQGRSSFSTWLTRIVINSSLMSIRRRKSHPECSLDEILDDRPEWLLSGCVDTRPNPEQACAAEELNALVEEQIRQLPLSQQAPFRLCAIGGYSTLESCEALSIPPSTAKSRVRRARLKLACELQDVLGKAA